MVKRYGADALLEVSARADDALERPLAAATGTKRHEQY
jgi:hypothetical protein